MTGNSAPRLPAPSVHAYPAYPRSACDGERTNSASYPRDSHSASRTARSRASTSARPPGSPCSHTSRPRLADGGVEPPGRRRGRRRSRPGGEGGGGTWSRPYVAPPAPATSGDGRRIGKFWSNTLSGSYAAFSSRRRASVAPGNASCSRSGRVVGVEAQVEAVSVRRQSASQRALSRRAVRPTRVDARSSGAGGRRRSPRGSTSLTAPPTERSCRNGAVAGAARARRAAVRGSGVTWSTQPAADRRARAPPGGAPPCGAHDRAGTGRAAPAGRAAARRRAAASSASTAASVSSPAYDACRPGRSGVAARRRRGSGSSSARAARPRRAAPSARAARGVGRVEGHRGEDDVADRVGVELERGDDAEVAAGAAHAPRTGRGARRVGAHDACRRRARARPRRRGRSSGRACGRGSRRRRRSRARRRRRRRSRRSSSPSPCGASACATSPQRAPGPSRTRPVAGRAPRRRSSAPRSMTMPPSLVERPLMPCPPLRTASGTSCSRA